MSELLGIARFRFHEGRVEVLEHFQNIGELADAILATVSVVHGEVLGSVKPRAVRTRV